MQSLERDCSNRKSVEAVQRRVLEQLHQPMQRDRVAIRRAAPQPQRGRSYIENRVLQSGSCVVRSREDDRFPNEHFSDPQDSASGAFQPRARLRADSHFDLVAIIGHAVNPHRSQ